MEECPSFSLECNAAGISDHPVQANEDCDLEEDFAKEFAAADIDSYIEEVQTNATFQMLQPGGVTVGSTDSSNHDKAPFVPLDEKLFKEINNAGISKSEKKLMWARKRFDLWRSHVGVSTEKPIEQLNLKEFASMLELFILQVVKNNGAFYPAESIQDMFRKFGAIIRRHQEQVSAELGKEFLPFCIRASPIFKRARLACIASMRRSRSIPGVCKKRKQVDEVSYQNEKDLLSDIECQMTDAKGLLKRILWYCVSRFGIRGQSELIGLKVADFTIGKENRDEFVESSKRLSKNYDVAMNRYQEEQFRHPLMVFEDDVVKTFKQFFRHYPEKGFGFVFMQVVPKARTKAWYNIKHRFNARVVAGWLKDMLQLVGIQDMTRQPISKSRLQWI